MLISFARERVRHLRSQSPFPGTLLPGHHAAPASSPESTGQCWGFIITAGCDQGRGTNVRGFSPSSSGTNGDAAPGRTAVIGPPV